jgi:GH15 family glucan-1,4-alpha-glucosidase
MAALLRLGCPAEAQAYFWWLVQATQLTHPRLQPLYRLDGGSHTPERNLPVSGYLGSRPARVGNAAVDQLQLDTYGELLATAWLYAEAGGVIDRDIGRRLGEIADLVCRVWQRPDAGIWEVRNAPAHFTHSKMMCWVALDRAGRLADRGLVPARHRARWAEQATACRDFIETHCYSPTQHSYTRTAGGEELDASVLLGLLADYEDPHAPRWRATVDTVREGLGHGPYLYRYTGEDGLPGSEGAFLSCSFWLAEALARTGRHTEATELMDQLVDLANDVGVYAEEIDPASGAFLGNLPQGLTHLALISAATAITQRASR